MEKNFFTLEPSRVLEIGCFEGRSTCYVIEKLASRRDIELHSIRCPKLAIDVFTNIYCRKLKILGDYSKLTSLWQIYVEKLEN